MPRAIPQYLQVLRRTDPSPEMREHLEKAYELGGVLIDENMKKCNPNAKENIICITSSKPSVQIAGAEEFQNKQEQIGSWVYCGHFWYVRRLNNKYEFAQYLAYNTKTKDTEGLWDQTKYL